VGQQPTSTGTQPPSTSFGPVNRDGCVSSVNGTIPVDVPQSAPQPEVFRGHILDPEVAAIPRVPDDSQQVTTVVQPEILAQQQPVIGFQPEILADAQQQPVPSPQSEILAQQQPVTGVQPEILNDLNAPTGPRRNILSEQNAQTGPQRRTFGPTGPQRRTLTPKQPVTGSQRRFRTARRSYF